MVMRPPFNSMASSAVIEPNLKKKKEEASPSGLLKLRGQHQKS